MNEATIIRANGTGEQLDHRPSLKEAQKIVGGYIELVKARDIEDNLVTLVVDEEGKLKKKPVNKEITRRFGGSIFGGYIVGDVIVLVGWRTVGS